MTRKLRAGEIDSRIVGANARAQMCFMHNFRSNLAEDLLNNDSTDGIAYPDYSDHRRWNGAELEDFAGWVVSLVGLAKEINHGAAKAGGKVRDEDFAVDFVRDAE